MTDRPQSLAEWLRLIGSTTIATAAIAGLSLMANILIFRFLPPSSAGLFALLAAISQSAALLIGCGQPSLITRLYSLEPIGSFDWWGDLVTSLGLALPLVAAVVLAGSYFYSLEAGYALLLGAFTGGSLALMHLSKILNTQRRYVAGSILLRLPNSLLLVGAILAPLLRVEHRLAAILTAQLLTIVLSIGLALIIMMKKLPLGRRRITLKDRLQGLMFVVSNTAASAPFDGMIVAAGLFLDRELIAVFAALFALLRPALLLYNILNQVFLTELARGPKAQYAHLMLWILASAAVFSLGSAIVVPTIASWVYDRQYDRYAYLIPLMATSVGLYLIEVLPRSIVFARARLTVLNRFVLVHALVALVGIGVGIVLIIRQGLTGLAQAAALVVLLRVAVSYSFFALPGKQPDSAAEPALSTGDLPGGEEAL